MNLFFTLTKIASGEFSILSRLRTTDMTCPNVMSRGIKNLCLSISGKLFVDFDFVIITGILSGCFCMSDWTLIISL